MSVKSARITREERMSDHGFASPTADTAYADAAAAAAAAAVSAVGHGQQRVGGVLARCLSGVHGWTALLALILVLVAYDQRWWSFSTSPLDPSPPQNGQRCGRSRRHGVLTAPIARSQVCVEQRLDRGS